MIMYIVCHTQLVFHVGCPCSSSQMPTGCCPQETEHLCFSCISVIASLVSQASALVSNPMPPNRHIQSCLPLKVGFPVGSVVKNLPASAGDMGLIPGLGSSPGGGNGNLLQCSCLGNPMGQWSLVGYNPWGRKELDKTELLTNHQQHSDIC